MVGNENSLPTIFSNFLKNKYERSNLPPSHPLLKENSFDTEAGLSYTK